MTDSASNTATATFSITINPGLIITTGATLPTGYGGTAYSQALAASGGTGTGLTWTVTSGSPAAVGLSLSSGGVLSGATPIAGSASFTAKVTDSASNTASQSFSVTINAILTISTGVTLPAGVVGTAYTDTLAATGGTGTGYTWSVTSGGSSLTAVGLSLSSAGVVSGSAPTAGTATFTAQVTDSASHTTSLAFSLTVSNALTVTTTSLPAAYSGTAYSQPLAAAGGSGSGYAWTVSGSSNLSTFNLTLTGAGLLSGTPTTTGTASFTAKVTDSASNTAMQAFTIPVYAALTLPTPSSSIPGPGTTGESYTGSISASGGSGAYTWTVTGLPSDGLSATLSGGTLNIGGTPSSATTVTFTAKVTDTTTGLIEGPFTYSIVVSNPPPLTLPTPNPTSLPSATATQSYTGFINATGGVGPNYTWNVSGNSIPTNGSQVTISNGITVSNTGGNTLTVGGTPGTIGTVMLNVSVMDSASHTAGPTSYTITVNSAGSQVNGTINLNNNCGNSSVPAITVAINTSPVQTTTTDSNGNFSFASIPNGTYTITPSITGPSSVFYPATYTGVVVTNGAVGGKNFSVSLGYTVSDTVSYAGSKTGQVYLALNGTNCGGNGEPGTSITNATLKSTGAYTIRGVPPGAYTLQAWMDTQGFGAANAANPVPLSNPSVTVVSSSPIGQNVALVDPATVSLSGLAPTIKAVSPFNQGAMILSSVIENSSKVEIPASYTVQWSTSAGFGTVAGSKSFLATGTKGAPWLVAGLTNSKAYYFRVQGVAGSSTSNFSSVFGPVTIDAPTGGNTVSGTVTFSQTATGPLYVGFVDQNTNAFYATSVGSQASPPTSPATYTVQVPSGTDYFFFGILDQNNNGIINGPGEISNTGDGNDKTVTSISANMSGEDLTLPTANSTATVTTQYYSSTYSGGTSSGYNLSFDVRAGIKLPVAVTLTSGPNMINPVDLGGCTGCGSIQFQLYSSIGSDVPSVGDAYAFKVTYSDASTDTETVTATVTGWNGTSSVVGASDLATSLAPTGTGSSTTPTFTWTYPASPGSYIYQFYISDNNGNTIWQIPGNNANVNGFPDTVAEIVWGTDPTGDTTNHPSPSSLTTGTQYNWAIQAQDSNGNTAQTAVYYIP